MRGSGRSEQRHLRRRLQPHQPSQSQRAQRQGRLSRRGQARA